MVVLKFRETLLFLVDPIIVLNMRHESHQYVSVANQ